MPVVERESPPRRWFMDLRPLKDSPAYRRFWISGVASGIGSQLTAVAIGIQIYDISNSTAAVALVGGLALGPMIIMGAIGGTVVDAFDRRRVLIAASATSFLAPFGIAALAWNATRELWPYYALTTLSSTCAALVGASRFAIHPRLVTRDQLPGVAALSGVSAGLQAGCGPALAGLLIASVGYAWTYTTDCLLFVIGFWGIVSLPAIRPEGGTRPGPRALLDGARFLRSASNLRTAIGLHIVSFAVGRSYALLPAVGAALVGGGPTTVGLLAASGAVGVVVSGLASGRLGGVHAHGKAMAVATACFGVVVLTFGAGLLLLASLDRDASPARADLAALLGLCALLALAGAADNIAGIFRTTMMQSATPDAMRGRLQGLFTLVLSGGPRLGDVYAGFLAAATALWCPPLLGGVVILLVALGVLRFDLGFRSYDGRRPLP